MKSRQIYFCLAYVWAAIAMAQAQTATETVIHSFGNFPAGAKPYGTLVRDANGNLYGTTYIDGAAGGGLVFELDASGHYKILHNFKGGTGDGANPMRECGSARTAPSTAPPIEAAPRTRESCTNWTPPDRRPCSTTSYPAAMAATRAPE